MSPRVSARLVLSQANLVGPEVRALRHRSTCGFSARCCWHFCNPHPSINPWPSQPLENRGNYGIHTGLPRFLPRSRVGCKRTLPRCNGQPGNKKPRIHGVLWIYLDEFGCVVGGEGGIRTHGRLTPTPDFESGTIDHSATSPEARILHQSPFCCDAGEPGFPSSNKGAHAFAACRTSAVAARRLR